MMMNWWEIPTDNALVPRRPRPVAYYRHSAHDRQENSIPRQREKIQKWADDHDIEIIREYVDGPSLPEESQDE